MRGSDGRQKIKEFIARAEQGDPIAQNNIGRMYSEGKGVPQNDKKADKWLRLTVKNGFSA